MRTPIPPGSVFTNIMAVRNLPFRDSVDSLIGVINSYFDNFGPIPRNQGEEFNFVTKLDFVVNEDVLNTVAFLFRSQGWKYCSFFVDIKNEISVCLRV